MRRRSSSRALLCAALVTLAAFIPGCATVKMTGVPTITGMASFPAGGGVTSGIEHASIGGEGTIEYIDFVGIEVSGKGRVSFRWKPRMSAPFYESDDTRVVDGGTWHMKATVVYSDPIRRHVALTCDLPIVTDDKPRTCSFR